MESAKNVRLIFPLLKFGMVRVNNRYLINTHIIFQNTLLPVLYRYLSSGNSSQISRERISKAQSEKGLSASYLYKLRHFRSHPPPPPISLYFILLLFIVTRDNKYYQNTLFLLLQALHYLYIHFKVALFTAEYYLYEQS